VVYIVTGSQGEYRSALARIARDEHREVKFTNGDCVIFSARVIPGNEKEINHTKNTLSEAGVVVIDRYATPIHASGHPYGDELEEMVRAVAPKNLIAVHGERMQQEAHAALAIRCGVAGTLVPRNGDVISISKVGVTVDGQIHAGFLGVDGRRIIPVDHVAIKERRKLRIEGIVFASLVIDKKGHVLADPVLITRGLLDMNDEVEADLLYELEDIIADHLASTRYKPSEEGMEKMETQIRRMIRKHFQDAIGIKPQADINIHVV